MQTLYLRFRALRAISLRQGLSRWRTPSDAMRAGMKGPPGLSNSPRPTCAVGWRPAMRHPDGILCPVAGAGLPGVSRLRAARNDSRGPVFPYRVCRWQTASELSPYPAHHEAGDLGATHWQARASEVHRTPSSGLSFPLRPQRCGARASGKKTGAAGPGSARSARKLTSIKLPQTSIGPLIARVGDGSGTMCSEAPGLRPTGRLKPAPFRKIRGQASSSFCADTPALVTGQEPDGTGVPGDALRWCARSLRWCLSFARGEGTWPAITCL